MGGSHAGVTILADGCSDSCVVENNVPEYSGIAAGLAIAGAGVGYIFLRRRK
ncbi:MAG TPA: hypothetical protein VJB90_00250 [Candidatus Nanoarchaeia archaeon]|nr:hypothetical protein [Candidatus Nanoarchaeia archaeon]